MKPSYLILLIVMNCFWAGTLSVYKALAGTGSRRHRHAAFRRGGGDAHGLLAVAARQGAARI